MRSGHRRLRLGAVELDDIDIRILDLLQDEGRISKSDLAKRIHLSNSACFERLRRLEASGIVESYHARIDVLRLGDPLIIQTHVILGSHHSSDFTRFETRVAQERMIVECLALGGGIDYSLTVCALSTADYQSLIESLLDADLGIKQYYTYIVTKRVKQCEIRIGNLMRPENRP